MQAQLMLIKLKIIQKILVNPQDVDIFMLYKTLVDDINFFFYLFTG